MSIGPKLVRIYYSSLAIPHYIDATCTRLEVSNYSVIFETILNKSQRDKLHDHITPGAVSTLYQILGKPKFYDTTLRGLNTIMLAPVAGSRISSAYDKIVLYVKNYSEYIDKANNFHIKIEGYISGEFYG